MFLVDRGPLYSVCLVFVLELSLSDYLVCSLRRAKVVKESAGANNVIFVPLFVHLMADLMELQ